MRIFYFTLLIILSFTNLIKANEKDQTINILQKGGNLIFIRHAYAPGGGDPENFNINNCDTQRNLNDDGRKQSVKIGNFFLSNEIPIDEVKVSKETDKYTKRFSSGHSLGFQYSPKKIIGGVDLSKYETLNCKEGHLAIFSGNLVHGAALNNTERIRFSIDFRIINKEYAHLTKKEHISAGNKPYFAEII